MVTITYTMRTHEQALIRPPRESNLALARLVGRSAGPQLQPANQPTMKAPDELQLPEEAYAAPADRLLDILRTLQVDGVREWESFVQPVTEELAQAPGRARPLAQFIENLTLDINRLYRRARSMESDLARFFNVNSIVKRHTNDELTLLEAMLQQLEGLLSTRFNGCLIFVNQPFDQFPADARGENVQVSGGALTLAAIDDLAQDNIPFSVESVTVVRAPEDIPIDFGVKRGSMEDWANRDYLSDDPAEFYDNDTAEMQVSLRIEGSRMIRQNINSAEQALARDAYPLRLSINENTVEAAPVVQWADIVPPRQYADSNVPLEFHLALQLQYEAPVNRFQFESTSDVQLLGLEIETTGSPIRVVEAERQLFADNPMLQYNMRFPTVQARRITLILSVLRPTTIPTQMDRFVEAATMVNGVVLSCRRIFIEHSESYRYERPIGVIDHPARRLV